MSAGKNCEFKLHVIENYISIQVTISTVKKQKKTKLKFVAHVRHTRVPKLSTKAILKDWLHVEVITF